MSESGMIYEVSQESKISVIINVKDDEAIKISSETLSDQEAGVFL